MKINFEQFPLYTDITREFREAVDIKGSLANTIYMNVPGIAAHVLAEKIYKSEGEVELNNEEVELILQCAPLFSGVFMDSFNDYLELKKQSNDV